MKETTRWTTQDMRNAERDNRFRNCVCLKPEIILLSSTNKKNIQALNILEQFRNNKTIFAFIRGEHQPPRGCFPSG